MKKSTLIAATLALSAISFGSIAADSVATSHTSTGEYITITGDDYLTVNAEIYR